MFPPTGLYFHWPYCDRICPYCDFNVARNREVDGARWAEVLVEDVRRWADRAGPRDIQSIYLGGGTPSLMPLRLIGDLLDEISSVFSLVEDVEITLEVNPDDGTDANYADWKSLGINRLSLGIQSFDDNHLAFLGRSHDAKTARASLERAYSYFDVLTFDTIYGLPDEDIGAWQKRAQQIAAMGAPHLSVYQLTIEPKTAFARATRRGDWHPHTDDSLADYFSVGCEVLEAAGYEAYEISSYSQPGRRARHNSLYWTGGDWLGIGPGAAGRITDGARRYETLGERGIKAYLSADFAERYHVFPLSDEDILIERLAGGLRLREGLAASDVGARWEEVRAAARPLADQGLLNVTTDRIFVTKKGRLLTDGVVRELISSLR